MKTYGELEMKLHILLVLALDSSAWSVCRTPCIPDSHLYRV